jgi:hypothetical protein
MYETYDVGIQLQSFLNGKSIIIYLPLYLSMIQIIVLG